MRPTLLNSCASAATAAEARFRIDAKPGLRVERATRVVALDAGAAEIVRPLARPAVARLPVLYDADVNELADADFVLMIATNGDGRGGSARPSVTCACCAAS